MGSTKNTRYAAAPKAQKEVSPLEKLATLRKELNEIFLERSHLIDGVLAVLMMGGNGILFGPPGTAKSMLLRQLCMAIVGATFFDRLLQKAQPPEELLGQPSLKRLKEEDLLVRHTRYRITDESAQGILALLDEIYRCNPTTLNSLLRIINEHEFENPTPQAINILAVFGAANNPPDDEELRAFDNRFIYRPWVSYCRDLKSRLELVRRAKLNEEFFVQTRIGLDELGELKKAANCHPFNVDRQLVEVEVALEKEGFVIGDRRRQKLVKLLQAYAFLQGDSEVFLAHIHELLPDCLWIKSPDERQKISKILDLIIPDANRQALTLYDLAKAEVDKAMEVSRQFDNYPYSETGQRLIQAVDSGIKQVEAIAKKIEKIISDNGGKNCRSAKRYLQQINEGLLLELGEMKSKVLV